jgi:hypothetical protein
LYEHYAANGDVLGQDFESMPRAGKLSSILGPGESLACLLLFRVEEEIQPVIAILGQRRGSRDTEIL